MGGQIPPRRLRPRLWPILVIRQTRGGKYPPPPPPPTAETPFMGVKVQSLSKALPPMLALWEDEHSPRRLPPPPYEALTKKIGCDATFVGCLIAGTRKNSGYRYFLTQMDTDKFFILKQESVFICGLVPE